MLHFSMWQEIWASVRTNKLRTFLTGFSVAWGIFMLVILLGSGKGLENGVKSQFSEAAKNSVWMGAGYINKPYAGFKGGRKLNFHDDDYNYIVNTEKCINKITNAYNLWGNNMIRFNNNYSSASIRALNTDFIKINNAYVSQGRFINQMDVDHTRKVAVVGHNIAQSLSPDKPLVGEYIQINKLLFRVVGIFKNDGWHNEMNRVYIPVTVGQKLFGKGTNIVHDIIFTTGDMTFLETDTVVERIKVYLSNKYKFDPEDKAAVSFWRNGRQYKETMDLFKWIRIFIWVVGIGTIIAGIVGISNIMLIVVKERTKEIGVRKAIGARPALIISEVLLEAIFVTGLSGFFGLAFGMLLLDAVNNVMPPNEFFVNPGADVSVAAYSLILLVTCGTLAGFFPARYAAGIKPVIALRDE